MEQHASVVTQIAHGTGHRAPLVVPQGMTGGHLLECRNAGFRGRQTLIIDCDDGVVQINGERRIVQPALRKQPRLCATRSR